MAPIYLPETLAALGRAYDAACEMLSASGAAFNRELLAAHILRNAEHPDEAKIVRAVAASDLSSHRVWESDGWHWELQYQGHVVESGTADSSVEARAAAMLAGMTFRLH